MAAVVCDSANPKLLQWSRLQSGYSTADAAKWLRISEAELKAIEAGNTYATLAQLRKLASHYKRPLAVFFMPEAPSGIKKPKDFRAHAGNESPPLLKSIRRARFVQESLSEFSLGQTVLWNKKTSLTENVEAAREWLGLDDIAHTKNRDVADFYRKLVKLLDDRGISVLHHSFPRNEAKAYSFAEAPRIIVISTNDTSLGGRIFSILHELCHISKGQSGLCIPNDYENTYSTERECDKFAAAFLMPLRLVKELVKGKTKDELLDDNLLKSNAETLKTSMYALLIRYREMEIIDGADISRKLSAWRKIPPRKGGGGGQTRVQKALKENGNQLTVAVIHAYNGNEITAGDASYYLNINQSYLNEVGEKVRVA